MQDSGNKQEEDDEKVLGQNLEFMKKLKDGIDFQA